jgi:hypothetical protein
MTGILSVFMNTESADIFVTACDMPYINAILIKYMIEKYNDKFEALIPLYDGKPQPLFGIYAKRISGLMEQRIRAGKKSLLDFVAGGKGLAGCHAATDCLYNWKEYGDMMGGYFQGHPFGNIVVKLDDAKSPLMAANPDLLRPPMLVKSPPT